MMDVIAKCLVVVALIGGAFYVAIAAEPPPAVEQSVEVLEVRKQLLETQLQNLQLQFQLLQREKVDLDNALAAKKAQVKK